MDKKRREYNSFSLNWNWFISYKSKGNFIFIIIMTINEFNGKSFINEGILIILAIHNLRRLENGKNFNCNWLNSPICFNRLIIIRKYNGTVILVYKTEWINGWRNIWSNNILDITIRNIGILKNIVISCKDRDDDIWIEDNSGLAIENALLTRN